MQIRLRPRIETVTLILLAVSVAFNLRLAYQVHQGGSVTTRSSTVPPGSRVPSIAMTDTLGQEHILDYRDRSQPTFVYWFQPTCIWCKTNLPNFRALAAAAGGHYRLVPVSVAAPGALAEYANENSLEMPLYTITPQSAKAYGLNGTPDSILISPEGVVVKRWSGAYAPRDLTEIEAGLLIHLPGLTPATLFITK